MKVRYYFGTMLAAWALALCAPFAPEKARDFIEDGILGSERRKRDRWLRAHLPSKCPLKPTPTTERRTAGEGTDK